MSGANFDELKHKRYTLRREWTLSHVHIPKFKDICTEARHCKVLTN